MPTKCCTQSAPVQLRHRQVQRRERPWTASVLLALWVALGAWVSREQAGAEDLRVQQAARPRRRAAKVFSVESFGARGNGRRDDSGALTKAFQAACSSRGAATVKLSARRTYLSRYPLLFTGPCKGGPLLIQIDGTLQFNAHKHVASSINALWEIVGVNMLRIGGLGTIHGKGTDFWGGRFRPHLLQLNKCADVNVSDITTVDAPRMHLNLQQCQHVAVQRVTTSAPADSPNTDSIHLGTSQDVLVSQCKLHSGDDCVSIVGDTRDVVVKGVTCTAGHGYSIGSLGYGGDTVCISNITVADSTLWGTTNGLRIKSYQGGQGFVDNVVFQNIQLFDVRHPIILDQFYCDKKPCTAGNNAVALHNIQFQNIVGTTTDPTTEGGIILDCSPATPCSNIVFNGINIWSSMKGGTLSPKISAAYGKVSGLRSPAGVKLPSAVPSNAQGGSIQRQAAKCGIQKVTLGS